MNQRFFTLSATVVLFAAGAPLTFAQTGVFDSAFQVRYAANLNIGDSVINVTNTGASSTSTGLGVGTGAGAFGPQGGNICVNVYLFDQSEELLSCCSCLVTPDGLNSFSVRGQLNSNNLTPEIPNSVVIKLLSTVATPPASANTALGLPASNGCLNSAVLALVPTVPTGGSPVDTTTVHTIPNEVTPGLAAWGTTIHALPVTPGSPATTYAVTETPFTPATLSFNEGNRFSNLCGFIISDASGFGICKGCSVGGLGATAAQ